MAEVKKVIISTWQHQYLLLDPFNHLYNPAKNVKSTEFYKIDKAAQIANSRMYPDVWNNAFRSIVVNGLG